MKGVSDTLGPPDKSAIYQPDADTHNTYNHLSRFRLGVSLPWSFSIRRGNTDDPAIYIFFSFFYDNIQFNSQVPSRGLASLIIFNTDFFLLVITIDICLKGGCPSLQGRFSGAILREDLIRIIAVLIRMIRFGDRKGSAEAIVLCNMEVSLIYWLKVAIDR